jgi:hypothetical protein
MEHRNAASLRCETFPKQKPGHSLCGASTFRESARFTDGFGQMTNTATKMSSLSDSPVVDIPSRVALAAVKGERRRR